MTNSFHSTPRPASNGEKSDEDEKRPKKKKTPPPPKVDYSPVISAVTAIMLPGTKAIKSTSY
jgi:hypothetical protein